MYTASFFELAAPRTRAPGPLTEALKPGFVGYPLPARAFNPAVPYDPPLLLAGLVLLGGSVLLELTWLRRLPA